MNHSVLWLRLPLSFFLAASLFGCGGGNSSSPAGKRIEDTPKTRLAAVNGHGRFSALVTTPSCNSATRTVRATVHEGDFLIRETIIFGDVREVIECHAEVIAFIDSATGLFRSITRCRGAGTNLTSVVSTSDYSISGDSLRIGKVGTMDNQGERDGPALRLHHARSETPSLMRKAEDRELVSDSELDFYALLCR